MKCLNYSNKEVRDMVQQVVAPLSRFGDTKQITELVMLAMNRNNGNDLSLTPNGEPSEAMAELNSIYGPEEAMITRLTMYTDRFLASTGDWTKTGNEPSIDYVLPNTNVNTNPKAVLFYGNGTVSSVNLDDSKLIKEEKDYLKCKG